MSVETANATAAQLDMIVERHRVNHRDVLARLEAWLVLRAKNLRRVGDPSILTADAAHEYLDALGLSVGEDRRFLGALWRTGVWRHAGYVKSARKRNHGRPVAQWRYVGP